MKPIGMPVSKLTADCIWNSFRNSGKQHLILTGSRGSGKSTLLNQLFGESQPGLTTWAEPRQQVWLRENITGQTARIGLFDPSLPGPGNQMKPVPEVFLALGLPALQRCGSADSEWITVDEIGYLEASCQPYLDALSALMEKKHLAAAVRKQDLPCLQTLCRRKDVFRVDLDDPFGNIGCVIMASGMGKRFGGNKLMAPLHGSPMISRILDATDGIFAQRVVVTRHTEVAELCRQRGIRTVLHDLPSRSDTVRLGLAAAAGTARCMFCPADQPLLRRQTVAALALASQNDPEAIWRIVWQDIPGAPVVFPRWSFPELETLPEGKGGTAILKKYPERLRTVSVRDKAELLDVDTPEDLALLVER